MRSKVRFLAAALAGLLAITLAACAPASQGVEIADGWVRASEFSAEAGGMTGAFAKITNTTNTDVTLVGGSAEIAGMVEIHEVVMLDNAMKMQKKEGGIVIGAGQTIVLEPGGLHVMLMDIAKPIVAGDTITLTLDFEGTESQTVTWTAKTSEAGDEEYHSGD